MSIYQIPETSRFIEAFMFNIGKGIYEQGAEGRKC